MVGGDEEAPAHFDGLSRREVVQKIGYGSMVALPIVAAVVAPSAVYAQSLLGPGSMGPTCFSSPPITNCLNMCTAFGVASCSSGSASLVPLGGPCNLSGPVPGCGCECD